MRRRVGARLPRGRTIVVGVAAWLIGMSGSASAAESGATGAQLYGRFCASCHGSEGRGDGPDARFYDPRPRELRSGFLDRFETEALVRRLRDGTPLTFDVAMLRARAKDTDAIAAHLQRLADGDGRRVYAGQQVFIDRCERCHGPFGRGPAERQPGVRPPRDLADPAYQRRLTDRELSVVVRHGREGMPALTPRISERDAALVAVFVRMLSPGYELYSRHCAGCHGDDGRGDGGFVENRRRPTLALDRRYFEARDPEEVRQAIWHMLAEQKPAMPHLREALTATQARAIIEYLKAANAARSGASTRTPAAGDR